MQSNSYSYLPTRARLRRVAPWVLTFWAAFLLLTFMQPCCEVLAAALPHDHSHLNTGSHHDDTDDVPAHHDHCTKFQNLHSILPDTIPLTAEGEYAWSIVVDAGSSAWSSRSKHTTVSHTPFHHGTSPPLYLSTLRLRI